MYRKVIYPRLRDVLLTALVFILPFGFKVLGFLMGMWLVAWLALGNFGEKFRHLRENKVAWPLMIYYLVHLAGMLYTSNTAFGWFDLQVKFSLLLIPLVLSGEAVRPLPLKFLLFGFVAGCAAASLACLTHVGYIFFTTGEWKPFYYDLSRFLHPGYFAMYLTLAIFIMSGFWIRLKDAGYLVHVVCVCVLSFFFLVIYLLQSKAGILVTAGMLVLLAAGELIRRRSAVKPFLLVLLFGAGYWVAEQLVITASHSRMYNARYNVAEKKIDARTGESSQVRLLIWDAASEIFRRNMPSGTGTGDVKDELVKEYRERGMKYAAEHKLNAHNQLIQSAVALGFAGLILLLLVFVYPLPGFLHKKNYTGLAFLIITFVNFQVESMLETQAGVLFFAVFYGLLVIYPASGRTVNAEAV